MLAEVSSSLLMALLPIVLLPLFGLKGAAIGYFAGFAFYAVVMLVVARRRCGHWLRARTLVWFLGAACLLLVAQAFAQFVPGTCWGSVPTALVAVGCFYAYRRVLSAET